MTITTITIAGQSVPAITNDDPGLQMKDYIVEFIRGVGIVTNGVISTAQGTTGPFTYTPPLAAKNMRYSVVSPGAGGAGGFAGGGGGGGGSSGKVYKNVPYPFIPGDTFTINLGVGGLGGAIGANGAAPTGTTSISGSSLFGYAQTFVVAGVGLTGTATTGGNGGGVGGNYASLTGGTGATAAAVAAPVSCTMPSSTMVQTVSIGLFTQGSGGGSPTFANNFILACDSAFSTRNSPATYAVNLGGIGGHNELSRGSVSVTAAAVDTAGAALTLYDFGVGGNGGGGGTTAGAGSAGGNGYLRLMFTL